MDSEADEELARDEAQGTAPTPRPAQNAFTALMAPKPKPKPPASKDRLGLGAYISSPSSFPASVVIYHNADFVAILDKFPKSTIHTLLLARSPAHNLLHPYEAFKDAAFLAKVQQETVKLRAFVAAELQRRLGQYSGTDAARQAVLNGDKDSRDGELPEGRDWGREVKAGVHAVPSMAHLHVHVLSRDMHSGSMKHRKHYNSFNTPFLVDVADFPLGEDDERLRPGGQGYLRTDLRCWRCGRGFGNQFARLKEHLEEEFMAWRAE
ncbi:aprataxin-like protein [Metarhizium album ARSEF 1941]|uniref:Aprataxin-like protein n=1 Tax=Metarhizium album (strain ARSEF 1941) TaxID=1081103 RepID=A0A0B2WNL3_METAS|nr:aprataxin-like protein [Metarhizium album ARSEF 1941]KHN94590.1 aprataxin-like protein [Metarhizium album ARSEF 1941]